MTAIRIAGASVRKALTIPTWYVECPTYPLPLRTLIRSRFAFVTFRAKAQAPIFLSQNNLFVIGAPAISVNWSIREAVRCSRDRDFRRYDVSRAEFPLQLNRRWSERDGARSSPEYERHRLTIDRSFGTSGGCLGWRSARG